MSTVEHEQSTTRDRLARMDVAAHNAEVKAVWQTYHQGRPIRTPIFFGINMRYFMVIPEVNPRRISFRAYSEDPDLMFEHQLRAARWSRFNILQDVELGWPEQWSVGVDFQNYYESAWFGCPIEYLDDQVPDTRPVFADCPERIMDKGLPDPFGSNNARAMRYYEHMCQRAGRETFLGRPISVNPPNALLGTDGPLTAACNLFGPDFVCTAMVDEPQRLHALLAFIIEATIARIQAGRKRFDRPLVSESYGFADDSVALISTEMYRQHVLPHHRRLCDALGEKHNRAIHLCGDATRHFVTLRDELNVMSFDTGFPVDFARLRRELGPQVKISGGPHVQLLLHATPQQVHAETVRILRSGILEGGMFSLREGNNLAPHTPLDNTEALYHAGREHGYKGS